MQTFVNADSIQSIDFNHKVITEEHKANNREEIDENDGEDSSQQDRSAVLGHRPDHVQQSLLPIDYIQQLPDNTTTQPPSARSLGSNTILSTILITLNQPKQRTVLSTFRLHAGSLHQH